MKFSSLIAQWRFQLTEVNVTHLDQVGELRIDHYKDEFDWTKEPNCVAEDEYEVDKTFLRMKFKLIIYEFDRMNDQENLKLPVEDL